MEVRACSLFVNYKSIHNMISSVDFYTYDLKCERLNNLCLTPNPSIWICLRVSLRKLVVISVHPGDCPNPGCERQQPGVSWRLLLEVPMYASLGGPSSGAGLKGQRRSTARRTTQLLPA